MTALERPTGVTLAAELDALAEAILAGEALGLDVAAATAVRDLGRERLRFPGTTYVLALAGGTGVGKSSLLNALAGREVSRAAARRPTTSEPVAWVPQATRTETKPLLEWLGVRDVREHDDARASGVAILDLPDLDSIAPEHRARVDELLPRVDAVIWVADPEKYRDAVLHDDYMRRWMPRLARQLVVVNKADRLGPDDGERIRRDLGAALPPMTQGAVDVVLASATGGEAGIDRVRAWIAGGADAKRIVAERVAAESRAAVRELAEHAGVTAGSTPLVPPARRAETLRDMVRESLGVLDLAGLEGQAISATRLAARPRGAGPLGPLTAAIYRWSGRAQVKAEPSAYLHRWRERGALARVLQPVRALVGDALAAAPPALRPRIASSVDANALDGRVATALDAAAAVPLGTAPTSFVWVLFGFGQYLVTATLVFAALWIAVIAFGQVDVASAVLPVLGPVPTPLLLLAGALIAGYILARLLGSHARWLGARWARRMRRAITAELEPRLEAAALAPLDAIEAARARLAQAHAVARGGARRV